MLAQVYLIEPEEVRPKVRGSSARSMYRTVNQLQVLADENGIGEIYRRLRDGVREVFSDQAYFQTVGYVRRLEWGGMRTLMLVDAVSGDDDGGTRFVAHGNRFDEHMGIGMADLRALLPGKHGRLQREGLERQFPGGEGIGLGPGGPVPQHV